MSVTLTNRITTTTPNPFQQGSAASVMEIPQVQIFKKWISMLLERMVAKISEKQFWKLAMKILSPAVSSSP